MKDPPDIHKPPMHATADEPIVRFMDGLARHAISTTGLRPTLEWVAGHVKEMLACDEVCIRFLEDKPRGPRDKTYVAKRSPGVGSWPPEVASSVAGAVVSGVSALRTPDLLSDERFAGVRHVGATIGAALVVPLLAEDQMIGVLAATEMRPGRQWTDDDERLITAIARHCGSIIEHVRLREAREQLKAARQREQETLRENRYAAEIQRHILPGGPLRANGWQVAGRLVPAAGVCGDSYDFRLLGDNRLCVTVSDVEGKGIPAAMLAVSVQMLLHEVFGGQWSMEEAQRHLCRDLGAERCKRLVTLVAAELDLMSGMLRYYRAGHPYPRVRRHDGRIEELQAGGPPLGCPVDVPMVVGHVLLEPGDAVLFFSDGVSEASDPRGRMFGESELDLCWSAAGALPPEEAAERVVRAAQDFRIGQRQEEHDDITVVVLAAPPRV